MKKSKKPMTKDTLPQGFTLGLSLVDAIPVLFFCASMLAVGVRFRSVLFLLGAGLVLFAGAAKVLWKILVVLKQKNIWWMFLQMRILMPIGMVLMLASVIVNRSRISSIAVWQAVTAMPSFACFLTGFAGIVLMTVFAFTLDSSDVKSNWIEQLTNIVAQASFFLGIVLLR